MSIASLLRVESPRLAGLFGGLAGLLAAITTYLLGIPEANRPLAIGVLTGLLFLVFTIGYTVRRRSREGPADRSPP